MEKDATIVTGGGRGIGRAISLHMARDTAVVIVGRTQQDLTSVRDAIVAAGGAAEIVVGDVTDPSVAKNAVAATKKRGWRVHNLVCNAGIGKGGAFESFDVDAWKRIMDVNVNGAFHCVQACVPEMLAHGGGTICLMSSVAGLRGYAYTAAYATSKHALVGLARSLAQEYGKRGIVVVPVCPGFVESDMTERTIHGVMERRGVSYEEARERVAHANPQRRIIPAEEVADAIAFACSGSVPSLSGSPLVLSGGE